MSEAVFCDECGRLLKRRDCFSVIKAIMSDDSVVFGAHICGDCRDKFSFDNDAYRARYKKPEQEGDEK